MVERRRGGGTRLDGLDESHDLADRAAIDRRDRAVGRDDALELALAVAASRTTNPLLLGLIIAVAGVVVANRRSDAPWALAFRLYAYVGALIVATRVLFRILVGGERLAAGEVAIWQQD